MSGLEEVGIPGSDHLREALTNCTDPLAAIEEFQIQNGILLPSLRPALPFLDLHGVNRLEFHESIMEELRGRLVQRIQHVAESGDKNKYKMLNDLLEKSFPVIKHKALRPVVMCLLQHLPKISKDYLKVIINDKELYKEAAVEVKQQIWQDHQSLFGDEVSPILTKYIEDKEAMLSSHESLSENFFSPSPKNRRQGQAIQQLTKMVGKSIKLYDMVLQFLRTLFLRTRNVHYCTLRAEILMTLHDSDIHEICSVDPCHKFTWCLDACIRERFVDSKRARELQGFLDGIRRGQEQVLGDLAMILCDPYAVNTVATSALKAMQQSVSNEVVPRNNEELILLLRMLSLGLNAWDMIDSQHFKEPKLETQLVTRFLPCLASLMVDDHIRSIGFKLPDEAVPQVEAVPEFLLPASRDNAIACTCLLFYSLQVVRQKDHVAVMRIVSTLAQCDNDTVYQDTFLHQLISLLAVMPDHFANNEFLTIVVDHFLMQNISREVVLSQLLRLLWWVHPKISPPKLKVIVDQLTPSNQHSPPVHAMFQSLNEKISTYQPSPAAEPEKLDSPLMSVPAPTPAPHRT